MTEFPGAHGWAGLASLDPTSHAKSVSTGPLGFLCRLLRAITQGTRKSVPECPETCSSLTEVALAPAPLLYCHSQGIDVFSVWNCVLTLPADMECIITAFFSSGVPHILSLFLSLLGRLHAVLVTGSLQTFFSLEKFIKYLPFLFPAFKIDTTDFPVIKLMLRACKG